MNKKIEKAMQDVASARERQAVGEEYAHDELIIKGITFFKPKVAHTWLFTRIKFMPFQSITDFGVCITYALAHAQKDVRNKIMPAVTSGSIVDDAYAFIIEHNLESDDVNTVLEKLAWKILKINPEEKDNNNSNLKKTEDNKKTPGK